MVGVPVGGCWATDFESNWFHLSFHPSIPYPRLSPVLQVSAYATPSRLQAERQRRRVDVGSSEPLFTNCTRDFLGTLDYIFYTCECGEGCRLMLLHG